METTHSPTLTCVNIITWTLPSSRGEQERSCHDSHYLYMAQLLNFFHQLRRTYSPRRSDVFLSLLLLSDPADHYYISSSTVWRWLLRFCLFLFFLRFFNEADYTLRSRLAQKWYKSLVFPANFCPGLQGGQINNCCRIVKYLTCNVFLL